MRLKFLTTVVQYLTLTIKSDLGEGLPGFLTTLPVPGAGTAGTKGEDGELGSRSSCLSRGRDVVKNSTLKMFNLSAHTFGLFMF